MKNVSQGRSLGRERLMEALAQKVLQRGRVGSVGPTILRDAAAPVGLEAQGLIGKRIIETDASIAVLPGEVQDDVTVVGPLLRAASASSSKGLSPTRVVLANESSATTARRPGLFPGVQGRFNSPPTSGPLAESSDGRFASAVSTWAERSDPGAVSNSTSSEGRRATAEFEDVVASVQSAEDIERLIERLSLRKSQLLVQASSTRGDLDAVERSSPMTFPTDSSDWCKMPSRGRGRTSQDASAASGATTTASAAALGGPRSASIIGGRFNALLADEKPEEPGRRLLSTQDLTSVEWHDVVERDQGVGQAHIPAGEGNAPSQAAKASLQPSKDREGESDSDNEEMPALEPNYRTHPHPNLAPSARTGDTATIPAPQGVRHDNETTFASSNVSGPAPAPNLNRAAQVRPPPVPEPAAAVREAGAAGAQLGCGQATQPDDEDDDDGEMPGLVPLNSVVNSVPRPSGVTTRSAGASAPASAPTPGASSTPTPIEQMIINALRLHNPETDEIRKSCPPLALSRGEIEGTDTVFHRALWQLIGPIDSPYRFYLQACTAARAAPFHLTMLLARDRPTFAALRDRVPGAAALIESSDSEGLLQCLLAAARSSIALSTLNLSDLKATFLLSNPEGTLSGFRASVARVGRLFTELIRGFESAHPNCTDNHRFLDAFIKSQHPSHKWFYDGVRDANNLSIERSRGARPVHRMLELLQELAVSGKVRLTDQIFDDGQVADARYSPFLTEASLLEVLQSVVPPVGSTKQPGHYAQAARERGGRSAGSDAVAAAVVIPARPPGAATTLRVVCFNCNRQGHRQRDCPEATRTAAPTQPVPGRTAAQVAVTAATASNARAMDIRRILRGGAADGAPRPPPAPEAREVCFRCGEPGHRAVACTRVRVGGTGASQAYNHGGGMRGGPTHGRGGHGQSHRGRGGYGGPARGAHSNGASGRGGGRAGQANVAAVSSRSHSVDSAAEAAVRRRILVPVLVGELTKQQPATAFLDSGADVSCMPAATAAQLLRVPREELAQHLGPPTFSSVSGVGASHLQSIGSLKLEVEVMYERRNLSLRNITDAIHGCQVLNLEIIDCPAFTSMAPGDPDSLVFIVGSNDLRGAPNGILCQLNGEAHLPLQYALTINPPASAISRDGFRTGSAFLGSDSEISQIAAVTTVPGDQFDHFVGRKQDAWLESIAIAALQGSDNPPRLWSLAEISAVAARAKLSPEAQQQLAQIICEEQPSRPFPTRIGDGAARLRELLIPQELRSVPPFRGGITSPIRRDDWPLIESLVELGAACILPGTPADYPDAWFFRVHVIKEVQPSGEVKPRLVIDMRELNAAMARLGVARRTRMVGAIPTLEILEGAAWLTATDLIKAYFQGRVGDGMQRYFMMLGPAGQVVCMDAWTMGFVESGGMLADGLQAGFREFNGWSRPAPPGFTPEGAVVTRTAAWFADNGYMALFVRTASGEKIFLEPDDPRRELLVPLLLESTRDYLRTFRDLRLSWSLPKSDFAVTELNTLGLHTDRRCVSNDKAAFQGLAAVVPPELGMTEARTSKQLQSVLGMLGYLAQCISSQDALLEFRHLYKIASQPLATSEARVGASNYGPEQKAAIIRMRDLLLEHQNDKRRLLDPTKAGVYVTDACNTGFSAAIYQLVDGRPCLIRCIAGTWNDIMALAKTVRQECFAYITGARAFDDVFPQLPAVLWRCDSRVLRWWSESTDPALRRWWFEMVHHLNLYAVCEGIQHLRGTLNPADYGSRLACMPRDPDGVPFPSLLPAQQSSMTAAEGDAVIASLCADGMLSQQDADDTLSVFTPVPTMAQRPWQPPAASALSDVHGPLLPNAARAEHALMAAVVTRSARLRAGVVEGGVESGAESRAEASAAPPPEPQPREPSTAPEAPALRPPSVSPTGTPAEEQSLVPLARHFPLLSEMINAQADGFCERDYVLEHDPAVYVHDVGGIKVLYRSGAIVISSAARSLIDSLLLRAHYRVTAHAAPHAMMQLLSYVHWVGMSKDIAAYVRSCVACQLGKAPRSLPASAYQLRMAMRPLTELQMDCLIFPARVAAATNRVGIFIISDDFSGWVWLAPIAHQTAAVFVGILEDRLIRNFPTPAIMRSDGHPGFGSTEMAAFMEKHNIEHRLSAAYNAREHGGVERQVAAVFERGRCIFNGDVERMCAVIERGIRNSPSEAHANLQPFEIVFGVRGEPLDRLCEPGDAATLEEQVAARQEMIEVVQRWMLRTRIDRHYRRSRAVGPPGTFAVGDTVMLLRPPADKLTQGAVGPYVVVDADEPYGFYSVALLGPDGEPTGSATRAAAGQLRRFDMSRTTPEREWLRLQDQEFGEESFPTRAVTGHRRSRRRSAAPEDLEFMVVWITPDGDKTTPEPVRHLVHNADFQRYVKKHNLVTRVKEQAARERLVEHQDEA